MQPEYGVTHCQRTWRKKNVVRNKTDVERNPLPIWYSAVWLILYNLSGIHVSLYIAWKLAFNPFWLLLHVASVKSEKWFPGVRNPEWSDAEKKKKPLVLLWFIRHWLGRQGWAVGRCLKAGRFSLEKGIRCAWVSLAEKVRVLKLATLLLPLFVAQGFQQTHCLLCFFKC